MGCDKLSNEIITICIYNLYYQIVDSEYKIYPEQISVPCV